jgi:hypothetical protein
MTMLPDRIYFHDEPATILGMHAQADRQKLIDKALKPPNQRRPGSIAKPARQRPTVGARRFWHTGCGASWVIERPVHTGYVETKPRRECEGCGETLPVEPKPW